MRLLLIEDHPQFSEYVKTCMEIEGFTVDACATLDEADAAASSVDYDAVILDLGLPDGDGMTLLKSWRSRKMTTPVLILSARDGVDDRVDGLNAGADDYVQKPIDRKELVARIHALLRRPEWYLGETLMGLVVPSATSPSMPRPGRCASETSRSSSRDAR